MREEHYPLAEARFQDVIRRLNGMRLEGASGEPSQGLTVYQIDPSWRVAGSGGMCYVVDPEINVTITVKLPSWPGVIQAGEEERRRWREILTLIRDHEYIHRDLTIEAAGNLLSELTFLRAGGCTALQGAVRSAIAVADQRLREAHGELDASIPSVGGSSSGGAQRGAP